MRAYIQHVPMEVMYVFIIYKCMLLVGIYIIIKAISSFQLSHFCNSLKY